MLRRVLWATNEPSHFLAPISVKATDHEALAVDNGGDAAMRRIIVVGCAGSGKTALARRLAERTGLPLICLDAIWDPNWSERNVAMFRSLLAEAHAGDGWISDGNFAVATFDIRMPRADLVVWLERPRLGCAWRAITRVLRPGETHKLRDLPRVLAFIWNFDRLNRPKIEAARMAHGAKVPVVRLGSRREIADFEASLQS